jgi:hypothetical protein
MASVRGFEARGVKLYGSGISWWLIICDGDTWISSRSLAPYLSYADPCYLVRALESDSSVLRDRASFPASILNFPNESNAHKFVKIAALAGGPKYFVSAKHALIPPLLGLLLKYVATWALDMKDERDKFQLQPSDRRLSAVVAPVGDGSTNVPLARGPRVLQTVIQDVNHAPPSPPSPHAPPSPRVADLSVHAALGSQFQDIVFDSESGSAWRPSRPRSFAEEVSATLHKRTKLVNDAILQEPGPPVDNTSLEARVFDRVLSAHGDSNRNPAQRYVEIMTNPVSCDRSIADMRHSASGLGHLIGSSLAYAQDHRMSWIISLDFFQLTAAHRGALEYYQRVRTVTLYSSQSGISRKWWLTSSHVTSGELSDLATALFVAPVPVPLIPHCLDTESGRRLAAMHPWLLSTSTSLGDASTDCDSFVMTSSGLIALATAVARMGRDLQLRGCSHDVIACQKKVGVGANIVVECSKCSIKIAVSSCGGDKELRALNRTAYVIRETSGRRQAVNRFLLGLGIGEIIERNGEQRFSDMFEIAVQKVFQRCEEVMGAVLVSGQTGELKVSADAFHARNSRQGQQGAAKASGVSFGIPGFRKIVTVVAASRESIDKSRDASGIAHIASSLGGELTAKRRGVEHQLVEMAFQYLKQLLGKGKIWASRFLENNITEEEIVRIKDQVLNSIVTDALTSAPASAQEVFGSAVSLFVDWWHRRTSWKKLLDKVEAKKGKGKIAKYPHFAGLKEILETVWSDVQYDRKPFSDFQQRAEDMVRASGVNVDYDVEHKKRWEKLMKEAQKLYEATHVDLGTSINEQFHAHIRFFAVKGDKQSPSLWQALVQCAYLSFNDYPSWRTEVVDEFLRISL